MVYYQAKGRKTLLITITETGNKNCGLIAPLKIKIITAKAMLVDANGSDCWIPLSIIKDQQTVVIDEVHEGTMCYPYSIPVWFFEKNLKSVQLRKPSFSLFADNGNWTGGGNNLTRINPNI